MTSEARTRHSCGQRQSRDSADPARSKGYRSSLPVERPRSHAPTAHTLGARWPHLPLSVRLRSHLSCAGVRARVCLG